jgi:hypothetical protein
MPLGISESALQAAYGPLDLSNIYKGLQNSINRIAKEEQLYRQQNLKEYLQYSSKLSEASKGARSEDTPEIINHMNKWKEYTKMKDSDPRMITTDPEKWQELQTLADEEYAAGMNKARESSDFRAEYKNFGKEITDNPYKYKADALATWDKANKMSLSQIKKLGLDNRDTYVSATPEINKIYDYFDKVATPRAEMLGDVETKGTGIETQQKQVKYKNVPEYLTYFSLAGNAISKIGGDLRGRQNNAFKILEDSDDYDTVVKQFQDNLKSASPSALKAMGLSTDMPTSLYLTKSMKDEVAGGKAAQSVASQYLAMKKFNEHYRGLSMEDPGFRIKDDLAKIKITDKLASKRSEDAFNRNLRKLGLGTPETVDVTGIFNTISTGGETGQKQTKELITTLNSNPLIDPNATMVTTGKNIVGTKADKYKNYTNSNKVLKSINAKEGDDEASIAEKMMKSNEASGLINININPASIRSGKVLAFSWVGTDGKTRSAFLDMQDPESANQMNKLIRKQTESRKQKAAAAVGLMGDVEGAFNDIQ